VHGRSIVSSLVDAINDLDVPEGDSLLQHVLPLIRVG
jgi:hypothetical protein